MQRAADGSPNSADAEEFGTPELEAKSNLEQGNKRMRIQIIGLAVVLAISALPISGPALAQAPATPFTTIPFVTEQPLNQWLASGFIDQNVTNLGGETIGEITDLLFDAQGRISTAIIGVGGFLGLGERNVGVPFSALTFTSGKNNERVIVLQVNKETLMKAPEFKAREKSMFQLAKNKAIELKDQAGKKIDDMRKGDPAKK